MKNIGYSYDKMNSKSDERTESFLELNNVSNSTAQSTEILDEKLYGKWNCRCIRKHFSWKTCAIIAVVEFLLLAALIVIVIVLVSKSHQNEKFNSDKASQLKGDKDADNGIDLRINAAGDSSCMQDSCIECKAAIPPNYEPLHCSESDANVKNGSCFPCGDKCLSLEDLLNKVKQGERNCPNGNELNCCTLSELGNLAHSCGDRGYVCYKDSVHKLYNQTAHEPLCICSTGSQSEHCRKPFTQMVKCKCFKSSRMFSGQENIEACNKVNENWQTCHMKSQSYNCLCDKLKENDDIRECPMTVIDLNF